MIPRCVTFFWDGSPMSWMRYMTLASFRYWNPDWEMHLYLPTKPCVKKTWESPELEDSDYRGRDYQQDIERLDVTVHGWQPPISSIPAAHACDLCEWECLATVGGFFSDMDVLYIQPMEAAYESVRDADAVFCLETGEIAIGFLASRERSLIFDGILQQAMEHYRPEAYQCAGTEAVYRHARLWPVNRRCNPSIGHQVIRRFNLQYSGQTIKLLPEATVYPYDWKTASKLYTESTILSKEVVGLHWFGGLEISQEMNRRWPKHRDPCTWTHYAALIA